MLPESVWVIGQKPLNVIAAFEGASLCARRALGAEAHRLCAAHRVPALLEGPYL
jgi:hypothetical protein